VPLYGGASAVHRSYDDANCSARLACRVANGLPGSMMAFSWDRCVCSCHRLPWMSTWLRLIAT